ncbi:hypothetical protein SY83_16430 [Paenibacillus swuensis]|uniref:Membrane dipeptidase n=1 Tax=Paenibacillus swuensis TaxID=1178515 RepID=A0A172TKV8_9BACL|nr:dipeptidase [Paenibacillus swuensis]ANE47606.1 hypothetical protein SY83_16430 [Paenibacillus swuensis]
MVIDCHCDVLGKMLTDGNLHFQDNTRLDVTYDRLVDGGVAIQTFAIWIAEHLPHTGFDEVLRSVDLFRTRILDKHPVSFIRNKADLKKSTLPDQFPGAILHLEGVDALEGHLYRLRILHSLGLRSLGLTWNHGNWAADGVSEPRNGGLSLKGRQFIEECNRLALILDVSHLSEASFWELTELAEHPLIASHSNAYAICNHPRNLNDAQIQSIIAGDGQIGLTFVPWFVTTGSDARIHQLFPHIDHICSLGGENHIGFGSDFDGISKHIKGLEHPGQFTELTNELQKHYPEKLVQGFLYDNMFRYYEKVLPDL